MQLVKKIDGWLNRVTMYRLVVYELLFLLAIAGAFAWLRVLPFDPMALGFSACFLFAVCWLANRLFASLFNAPFNPESTWITALILALIISPPTLGLFDSSYLSLAFLASSAAIASKYILAIRKKHLFNPAALGVALTALCLGQTASWWVGTAAMVPFVLIAGLPIVRKIHRFDLWWAFILAFFVGVLYTAAAHSTDVLQMLSRSFLEAPVFFFSTVMLTEPMTTPPTRWWRILYGAIVGFLFLPDVHIASVFLTPELALIIGNLFVYVVSPKQKLLLVLREKVQISRDVYEFIFEPENSFSFKAGQYMEWTLPHKDPDSRSIRRYFTISSSPTEPTMRLGVKFYSPASSFKKALLSLQPGASVVASQLAGDFTLPRNVDTPLVFIAGGIGITPFRSHLRYLLDKNEKRPITVLYSNKTPADAAYWQLLEEARAKLGVKTVYAFTDKDAPLRALDVRSIDGRVIRQQVPEYLRSVFYISGPQGMVDSFKELLLALGVKRRRIKTDYFPGFA